MFHLAFMKPHSCAGYDLSPSKLSSISKPSNRWPDKPVVGQQNHQPSTIHCIPVIAGFSRVFPHINEL
jgi:hypothetical protein